MRITIIGAGVSGLTCGVVLSEAGYDVTIVAKELRGTTSEAAAAIWFPYHIASPHAEAWAERTREVLTGLVGEPEAGVSLADFEIRDTGEVLRVPLMDTTRYLPYLRARFRGAIVQRDIQSFDDVDAEVVVNCSGYGARLLCDDAELVPGHGVAVITRRPPTPPRAFVRMADPLLYVIPRTGDCVLGGYDSLTPSPQSEVEAIFMRCREAVPELAAGILDVKHGIRPVRSTVRLERQGRVIHNYGHGGAGFTVSWGCAEQVLDLVRAAAWSAVAKSPL